MSDIAEMENKTNTRKDVEGRGDCGSPETLEPVGLEKINQYSGASFFLIPLRQVINGEIVSPKFHLVKFKCLNEKLVRSKSIF